MPITMLNDYIGVRHVAVSKGNEVNLDFWWRFSANTQK